MRLTQLSVFHPVIAITVAMTVVIFGVFAFFNLGLEQNPQLTVPIMTVTASYPGASAEAVEQDVTRPIEDAVVGVGNVKTMTSTSQTSLSTLTVEFQEGVNIDVAASDVQQRVSRILSTLPAEVEEPSYAKLDLNDVPVLNLAVSGPPGGDPTELYRVANDIARPALETSPGVGRVVVVGGQKPEVHVEVQPARLRAYGLTLNDVTNAVQSQFVNTSAGQATNPSGTQRASVRVTSGIVDLYYARQRDRLVSGRKREHRASQRSDRLSGRRGRPAAAPCQRAAGSWPAGLQAIECEHYPGRRCCPPDHRADQCWPASRVPRRDRHRPEHDHSSDCARGWGRAGVGRDHRRPGAVLLSPQRSLNRHRGACHPDLAADRDDRHVAVRAEPEQPHADRPDDVHRRARRRQHCGTGEHSHPP